MPAPRRLPEETKHRIRRQRLERRIARRYPMFAEQIVREELARKPAYFGLTIEQAQAWALGQDKRPRGGN